MLLAVLLFGVLGFLQSAALDCAILVEYGVEELEYWALCAYEGCAWARSSVFLAYAHYGDVYSATDASCSGDSSTESGCGFRCYF